MLPLLPLALAACLSAMARFSIARDASAMSKLSVPSSGRGGGLGTRGCDIDIDTPQARFRGSWTWLQLPRHLLRDRVEDLDWGNRDSRCVRLRVDCCEADLLRVTRE